MASNDPKKNGGFFASIASSLSNFGSAMTKSVNGLLGYEGLEVINPEGGTEDGEEEARKGRWKQEDRDSYWKMMQKYIGSDVTSMVTLPVLIFEPMSMLQRMSEVMEYSYLLDLADECEDPYMRLVYASSWFISVYYCFERPWKPFNPILGETYEMVNHGGITFIAEQQSPILIITPPMRKNLVLKVQVRKLSRQQLPQLLSAVTFRKILPLNQVLNRTIQKLPRLQQCRGFNCQSHVLCKSSR
ncbi:hypothetical protein L484_021276 [Morus notabilis]|uniref:Uncharacterized protein n=1 Tax=Morus notabilis TaxID=981085 RepID=W9S857_9ROSA|nr:hypothetical protein L484_021276 [Morus notabilis]